MLQEKNEFDYGGKRNVALLASRNECLCIKKNQISIEMRKYQVDNMVSIFYFTNIFLIFECRYENK